MNYKKIYDNLINKAQNRVTNKQIYYELHHIIPRCMGGSNNKNNLVYLLPEEHYIAHLLLVKIYPLESGLIYAAHMMANRNNKSYGWVKRKFATQNSIDHTGMIHTEFSKKKMSLAHKGVPKSKKHKENIRKKKLTEIEYKGKSYKGYDELKIKTGVSYHLYKKYYINGIDPEKYVGNNTHAMIEKVKKTPSRPALGKRWFNDGESEGYFINRPHGWCTGRLRQEKDSKGRYK